MAEAEPRAFLVRRRRLDDRGIPVFELAGLRFPGAFGSGPNVTNSPLLGSPLLWDGAGQVALVMGAWLSLFATLVVLVGLRKLTAPPLGVPSLTARSPAEIQGAMPAAVTTK